MQQINTLHASFPVIHNLFYKTFEPWRKDNDNYIFRSGIYTLIADASVTRVLSTDEKGILYIGKGIILSPNHRLGNLINALNKTDTKHEAGTRFNQQRFFEKYPLSSLQLHIELAEYPELLEAERLITYLDLFGEFPPLNRQGGKQL